MIININYAKITRQAIQYSGDQFIELCYLRGLRGFLLYTVDLKAHSIRTSFTNFKLLNYGE